MRVNRIPHGLRKMNMQELVDKYAEQAKPKPKPVASSPQKAPASRRSIVQVVPTPAKSRGMKRPR